MASKLGVHINSLTEREAMQAFIVEARPAIVKTLDFAAEFWRVIKVLCPEVLVTGRVYVDQQPLNDPLARAADFATRLLGKTVARERLITVWEGYNEVNTNVWPNILKQARFDQQMAHILHQEGMKYVAGSYGVGHPTDTGFVRHPDVRAAFAAADYISTHNYFAPRLDDPRDRDEHGVSWWLYRYRIWYHALPDECKKPLLITECGIDSGAPHFDPGAQGGWRSFTNPADYIDQLVGFDDQLQHDQYVRAAAIYCWGTLDPMWDNFDIKGTAAHKLSDYIASQQEPPGGPVGDYRSHYVLMGQGTPWEWYEALEAYFVRFRCTRGESVDDALKIHGTLGHYVTLINPREETWDRVSREPGVEVNVVTGTLEQVEHLFTERAERGRRFGS